ncbi:unnamed protein product [Symbiodinium natans]|uniref:Uncharacterized protein n=1 Tax=Symbiodinium natans TaxID=878477 RepID=A0A812M0A6_9DINO|nr:unnamed protein product [Symbiodinium natans]
MADTVWNLLVIFSSVLSLPALVLSLWSAASYHSPFWEVRQPRRSAASHENSSPDPFVLYGHIHMAKTGGSYVNGAAALKYERVCGHKGYSYDAFQANLRYAQNANRADSFSWVGSVNWPGYNRQKVPYPIMEEIGYEDCDLVSHEQPWTYWKRYSSWSKVELHLPCRDPIEHLLSQCNHNLKTLDCSDEKLLLRSKQCLIFPERFDYKLTQSEDEFRNFTVKCFNYSSTSKYIDYLGTKLQKKRVQAKYTYRPVNAKRNRSNECLLWNATARHRVEEYLMRTFPYYSFCDKCLGSSQDLFAGTGQ